MDTTDETYGVDADWGTDAASGAMPWTTGIRGVGLCLVRGLSIAKDSIDYLPDTVDLRAYVESNATDETIIAAVERVARADERISRVRVRATRQDGIVYLTITCRCGAGPFELVMTVTEAAVTLVSLQEAA